MNRTVLLGAGVSCFFLSLLPFAHTRGGKAPAHACRFEEP
jgi:hypothetical protein